MVNPAINYGSLFFKVLTEEQIRAVMFPNSLITIARDNEKNKAPKLSFPMLTFTEYSVKRHSMNVILGYIICCEWTCLLVCVYVCVRVCTVASVANTELNIPSSYLESFTFAKWKKRKYQFNLNIN